MRYVMRIAELENHQTVERTLRFPVTGEHSCLSVWKPLSLVAPDLTLRERRGVCGCRFPSLQREGSPQEQTPRSSPARGAAARAHGVEMVFAKRTLDPRRRAQRGDPPKFTSNQTSSQERGPAGLKHLIKRRKRK